MVAHVGKFASLISNERRDASRGLRFLTERSLSFFTKPWLLEKVSRLLKAELTPLMKKKISDTYKEMLISSTSDEIEIVPRFKGKAVQIKEEEKLAIFKEAMDELVEKGITFDGLAGRSYKMPKNMTDYLFSKFGKMRLIHVSDRKDIMKSLYLGNYEDPNDFSCVIKLFDYLMNGDKELDIEFAELELVFVVVFNLLRKHRLNAEELMAMRDMWKPKFQYLVNVIRVFTQHLKRKLDEEGGSGEQHSRDVKLLLVAHNVGPRSAQIACEKEEND